MIDSIRLTMAAALIACITLTSSEASPVPEAVLELGAQQYAACATCHGTDGKGMKAGDLVMAPSLHESIYVTSDRPEVLALMVLKGVKKEDTKYVQEMVALGQAFDDEKLAAVLTYVRDAFGGHDDEVTAGQVAKWREVFAPMPASMTRKEYERFLRAPRITGFSELTYAVYPGKWEEMPDFRTLEPSAEGKVEDGLIDLALAGEDLQEQPFGMVFQGTFEVLERGQFEFSVVSDDGSRLIVDGELAVDNDGVHSPRDRRKTLKLEPGVHAMRVEFFNTGGKMFLAAGARPKGGLWTFLSRERVGKGSSMGRPPLPVIPLKPENPGEAVIYRNFIAGSSPRGIAVGYPGGVNLCWDADLLNLSLIWRGDFMDGGLHWTGRGYGSQSPMGTELVKPAQGYPLQVLESEEESWKREHEDRIAYERDKAEPKKEIAYLVPHPDYRFLGYRLDERRFPAFRYRFQGLELTDFYEPGPAGRMPSLRRTLTVTGEPSADAYLRVATGGEEGEDGVYRIGTLEIRVDGGEPQFQKGEWLVPVLGAGEIEVEYRWLDFQAGGN